MAADPSTSGPAQPPLGGGKRSFDIAFLVSSASEPRRRPCSPPAASPPCSPPAKTLSSAFTRVHHTPEPAEPVPHEQPQPLYPRALLAKLPVPRLPLPYPLQLGLELLQHKQPLLPPLAAMYPGQNVCALCRISFRMTSDLVYHMRSHHRRQEDQQRRAREEKLRCGVCGESFRERHHLTRHMTAHTERDDEEGR